ncbi:MAG: ATP synthase F0 subunit B [Proteobacteria bacterium]|nr:ATP synthase F0 subunit B [Pseudomonadota bacterium]
MFLLQCLAIEGPKLDLDITLVFQTGVFLLILLFLNRFILKPYFRASEAREALTTGARQEAQTLQEKTSTAQGDYLKRRQKAYGEAEVLRKEQVSAARTEAAAHLNQTRQMIQQEMLQKQAQLEDNLRASREKSARDVEMVSKTIADKLLA